MASLQERLGLTTKDADFSAVGSPKISSIRLFIDQLGFVDLNDLLELSKGLSKIGAKFFLGFVVQTTNIKAALFFPR